MITHHDKQHILEGDLPTDGRAWQDRAACRDADPTLFDPPERNEDGTIETPHELAERLATAQSYCDLCPVLARCHDDAVRTRTEGFRAGQMHRYRLPRGERNALCGTASGYQRHRRLNQEPDDACRAAHNRDAVDRRARRRAA